MLGLATPSRALDGWQIITTHDRLNDRDDHTLILAAKEPSGGVPATLNIACSVDSVVGGWHPSLIVGATLYAYRVAMEFRFDSRPSDKRIARVFGSHGLAIDGVSVDRFRRAKRFRIQAWPPGASVLFYDFDLSGLAAVQRKAPCRRGRAVR